MTNHKRLLLLATMLAGLTMAGIARADDDGRGHKGYERGHRESVKQHKYRHYDSRRHHNRYYPARGHVVNVLPRSHHHTMHRGTRFYYSSGIWYRHSGIRYVTVVPPRGITIRVLPPRHTTVRLGSTRYYYANNVYYLQHPDGYVVADPPAAVVSKAPSSDGVGESQIIEEPILEQPLAAGESRVDPPESDVYTYPTRGQSKAQQDKDRAECRTWATNETGHDPMVASADDGTADYSNYIRALSACLEGRGYTVR